jgi:hypothetical protein
VVMHSLAVRLARVLYPKQYSVDCVLSYFLSSFGVSWSDFLFPILSFSLLLIFAGRLSRSFPWVEVGSLVHMTNDLLGRWDYGYGYVSCLCCTTMLDYGNDVVIVDREITCVCVCVNRKEWKHWTSGFGR